MTLIFIIKLDLPGWKTATLEYYYINYSDGNKSDKIIPEGISINNDF